MSQKNKPDRALVLRIIEQEASAAGAQVETVLGIIRSPAAKLARTRAMGRIIRETGCSLSGLAEVWGCDRITVGDYVNEAGLTREPPRYDTATIAALRWQKPLRAEGIIAGRDVATNRDICAWRNLGRAIA